MLSVVVLPAPEGPSMQTSSPSRSSNLRPGNGQPPGLAAAICLAPDVDGERAHGRHLFAAFCQGRSSTASMTKMTAMKLSA